HLRAIELAAQCDLQLLDVALRVDQPVRRIAEVLIQLPLLIVRQLEPLHDLRALPPLAGRHLLCVRECRREQKRRRDDEPSRHKDLSPFFVSASTHDSHATTGCRSFSSSDCQGSESSSRRAAESSREAVVAIGVSSTRRLADSSTLTANTPPRASTIAAAAAYFASAGERRVCTFRRIEIRCRAQNVSGLSCSHAARPRTLRSRRSYRDAHSPHSARCIITGIDSPGCV